MVRDDVWEEDDAAPPAHKKLFNQAIKLGGKQLLIILAASLNFEVLVDVTFGFVKCGQVRDGVNHFSMDLVLVEDT